MVNSIRFEFPVMFGFVTLTGTIPELAARNAGTVTTIAFPVTEAGNNTAVPKFTTAPAAKFEPLIVMVNESAPAVTATGARPKIVTGDGAVNAETVNERTCERPPPGCGLTIPNWYCPVQAMLIRPTTMVELILSPENPPAKASQGVPYT